MGLELKGEGDIHTYINSDKERHREERGGWGGGGGVGKENDRETHSQLANNHTSRHTGSVRERKLKKGGKKDERKSAHRFNQFGIFLLIFFFLHIRIQ